MSIPPVPDTLRNTRRNRVANGLHSIAVRLLRRARVADAESGLTPERLSLLSVLCYAGSKAVGELAEIEQVSVPAISRSLASLERLGLVRRVPDPSDRRRVVAHASPRGRRLVERGRARRVARVREELSRLTGEELRVVERAVEILAGPESGVS